MAEIKNEGDTIMGMKPATLGILFLVLLALGVSGYFLLSKGGEKAEKKGIAKVDKIETKNYAKRTKKLNRIAYGFAPFKSRRKKEAAREEILRLEAQQRS